MFLKGHFILPKIIITAIALLLLLILYKLWLTLRESQKVARLIGELKFDEVEKLLAAQQQKVKTDSWNQVILSNKSVMEIYRGKWEEAEKCFTEIEKHKTGKAVQNVVANNRAFLRLLQGRTEDAEADLISLEGKLYQTTFTLSEILKGNLEKAEEMIQGEKPANLMHELVIDFLKGLIKSKQGKDFSEEKLRVEQTGRNTVLPEIFNKLSSN